MDNDLDIDMLSQPLLTEEGFINEACINELTAAINNIPPAHERLKDDLEWSTKRWTNLRDITGSLAFSAIYNIDNYVDESAVPPKLETAICLVHSYIRKHFDDREMAELSLCDIARMLHDIIHTEEVFLRWNDEKYLKGWLDLDALILSVCNLIRTDRREFDRFNEEFEKNYKEKHA